MARLLIVDDDKDLLLIMSEYLSAYGFELELAYSAAQARRYLESSECDAIYRISTCPASRGSISWTMFHPDIRDCPLS